MEGRQRWIGVRAIKQARLGPSGISCRAATKLMISFSSSASSSSDDETEDEISASSRGRSTSLKSSANGGIKPKNGTPVRRHGSQVGSSGDSAGSATNLVANGISFTRSRSPASIRQHTTLLASKPRRHASPMNTRVAKQRGILEPSAMFPGFIDIKIRLPLTKWAFTFNVDLRKFGESFLLLGTLICAMEHLQLLPTVDFFPKTILDVRYWLSTGA